MTFEINTPDNILLKGKAWLSANAQASVVLVHGLGEHCGRFAHVATHLNNKGFNVFAMDLRGHGTSGGPRGHTPSYEALLNDLEALHKKAVTESKNLPVFIYGHSMGANIVCNYILQKKPSIKGFVLTSPFFKPGFEPPKWKVTLGKMMNSVYGGFAQATGLEVAAISRNIDVNNAYKADTLVHDKISARLFLTLSEAGQFALDNAASITTPCYLIHGTADRLTSCTASENFAAQNKKYVEAHFYTGLFHELHNEPEQDAVLVGISDWLQKQMLIA